MKSLFLILLLFLDQATFSQANLKGQNIITRENDGKVKPALNNSVLVFDSAFLARIGESAFEIFINQYADSLNTLKRTGIFPVFLEDAQFDYSHAGWSPSHHPFPLRYMIISKVNSCQSLKMLIDSKNRKYRKRPINELGIEVRYSNLSFYELAVNRYQEMNCSIIY